MNEAGYSLQPVGSVESSLTDRDQAPRQGDEGAPAAWLVLDPSMRPAMDGLAVGAEVIVLTWLDRARRDVLTVRPRGDQSRPEQGVFSIRSPDRPNPPGQPLGPVDQR
jgi:tRNA (Thr-GGU) A37 N-methylase